MWVCKIIFYPDKTAIFSPIAKRFNVTLLGYPMNSFKKKGSYYYTGAGIMIGDEKDKKRFIQDIKKDKRVLKVERNGDYIMGIYEQRPRLRALYDPELIRVGPVIIDNKGREIWEMGSFDKKALMRFVKHAKEKYGRCKLLKFTRQKAVSLSVLNIIPRITEKQKRALELAVKHGYYEYPREIELEKLAKLMKVSYSTYQAHLRKAEKRLMPFYFKRMP